MVPVARRNLVAEPGRLVMSVAGVAFAVLLVLIVVSLYRGWSAAGGLFREIPGDMWVAQAGTRDPFRSASLLPGAREDELTALPGVALAAPVYTRRVAFRHQDRALDAFFMSFAVPGAARWPRELSERFLPAPGHVVIDRAVARDADVSAGDVLEVLGRRLVVDRVQGGGNPLFGVVFVAGEDGPALVGLPDAVSFYLVHAVPGADRRAIARGARRVVPGSEIATSDQFAAATADLVRKGFLPVVGVLVGLGLVVGGAVIALTAYTATIEKARDYGVLKAIGASRGYVTGVVIEQSLIVGVLGAGLGLGAAVAAVALIEGRVPEFVTELRIVDAALVVGAVVAVSILAAYVPARRINAIDPAIVFRA